MSFIDFVNTVFCIYVNSKYEDCLNLLQVSSSVRKKGERKKSVVLDVPESDSDSDSDSDSSTKSDRDEKVSTKRKHKAVNSSSKSTKRKPKVSCRLLIL